MTSAEQRPCVLCVLSEEQRSDYSAELDTLHRSGVNLLFQPSPDDGLQQIGQVKPRMVVVGMTVDMMEGLEFVALLMRRYPDFDREIIVLPDKDDPFPPVLQRRDPTTGRSSTEHLDVEAATNRILAAVQDVDPYAAAVDEFSRPSLTASGRQLAEDVDRGAELTPLPELTPIPAPPPTRAAAAGMSPRTKWVLVLAGSILVGGSAAALLFGDDGDGAKPAVVPDAAPAKPRAEPPAPAPAPTPDEPNEPDEPDEPPTPALDLTEPVRLPFAYDTGESEPGSPTDDAAMQEILAAARAALDADPDARIEVGGHTSEEGSDTANQKLGRRRARGAASWLERHGIPATRIQIRNYESSSPVAPNDTAAGRSENRRATVRVVK